MYCRLSESSACRAWQSMSSQSRLLSEKIQQNCWTLNPLQNTRPHWASPSWEKRPGRTHVYSRAEHVVSRTNSIPSAGTVPPPKFTMRGDYNCATSNIITVPTLHNKCEHVQYAGETKTLLRTRFYRHRSHINTNKGTHVIQHFHQLDHSMTSGPTW